MRNTTSELCHHGIKGMHWGIRKDKKSKNSSSKKKVKIGKESVNKTLKVAGAIGITAVGVFVIPKIQNKVSRKVYRNQLANDIIDFDNLGPEIVRRFENR